MPDGPQNSPARRREGKGLFSMGILNTALLGVVIALLYRTWRQIVAIGPETQAALDELSAKISAEADQRAQEVIDAVSADADTAQAIRDKFAAVAAIVPDSTEPTEPGEPETPPSE